MDIVSGKPDSGKQLAALTAFLSERGLRYAADIDFSVLLYEEDVLIATGSLAGSVVKCVAVAESHVGENLVATILTELHKEAFFRGTRRLFLYTKPGNARIFSSLGYFEIARTTDCLLMENVRDGIGKFIRALDAPPCNGPVGCVVANCNPFTRGHRYLIELAAQACALLHVFVLSEERSLIPAADRLRLVRCSTADLPNVLVHETDGYMVSAATFPDYFLRDAAEANEAHCALDLAVFTKHFVKPLHITKRFVGTEPLSPVTAAYNRAMQKALPPCGVAVIEIPRLKIDGAPVSASRVRAYIAKNDYAAIEPLVPPATYRYLLSKRLES